MLEKMKEIIADQLGVSEDEVTLEASFKEDLDADSLDLFELVMLRRRICDVKFHLMIAINTVGDVVNFTLKDKIRRLKEIILLTIAFLLCRSIFLKILQTSNLILRLFADRLEVKNMVRSYLCFRDRRKAQYAMEMLKFFCSSF